MKRKWTLDEIKGVVKMALADAEYDATQKLIKDMCRPGKAYPIPTPVTTSFEIAQLLMVEQDFKLAKKEWHEERKRLNEMIARLQGAGIGEPPLELGKTVKSKYVVCACGGTRRTDTIPCSKCGKMAEPDPETDCSACNLMLEVGSKSMQVLARYIINHTTGHSCKSDVPSLQCDRCDAYWDEDKYLVGAQCPYGSCAGLLR